MAEVLNAADADRLRNFADSCGRVARTARQIAPANPDHLHWRLLMLAGQADAAAVTARDIAYFACPETAGEDGKDGQLATARSMAARFGAHLMCNCGRSRIGDDGRCPRCADEEASA